MSGRADMGKRVGIDGWDWDVIVEATGGRWCVSPGEGDGVCCGVAIDTREIARGQAFVAFVGERVDGHAYLEEAARRGAGLCVVSDGDRVPEGFGVPTIVVGKEGEFGGVVGAMTGMARVWRGIMEREGVKVVGVTGSNGKTTTTRLVHGVLGASERGAWVSSKSHNNAIGVPMSVLNTPLDVGFAVYRRSLRIM